MSVPQPPAQNVPVTSAAAPNPASTPAPISNSSRRSSFTIPARPRAHSSNHSTSPYVIPSPSHFQYPQQQIYNQKQQHYGPPAQNSLNLSHDNENIDTAPSQQQHTKTHSRSPSDNSSASVPLLTREFVVRRISEGETGRLKQELKCEACGKGYKHISSLAKHLWEHTAEWNYTKKLLISKHQQVQLLEAASILVSMNENDKKKQQQSTVSPEVADKKASSASPIPPQYKYQQGSDQKALHQQQFGSVPVILAQDPRASFNNNSQRPILNNLDTNRYFESPQHLPNEYVTNMSHYTHPHAAEQHPHYMESAIDEEDDDEEDEYNNDDARSQ